METKAKLLGHPIHVMLIVFPLGLLATGVVFDLIYFATDDPVFATVAYWMIAAGIVGGLLAAPFGLIDWLSIPRGTRARSLGGLHGLGNVVVLLLFTGSWFLRGDGSPGTLAYILSFAAVSLAVITGWMGGELVHRLGVSVDEGARLDAPSSLSSRTIN